jgi:hypothetical protein
VATGAVKPVAPPSFGSEFSRVAAGMFPGVSQSALTGPQIEAINKRVDAVKASTAPKFSVDLSDPTAVGKARLDVITKWEGVLKSGGDVELSNRYNALQSSVALANKGNSVADGATIYNLAKMYDPSGAVQEGDKKTVIGNPSVPDRVKLLLQQLSVGGSFTPEQRKNMLKIADELVQQRESALQRQAKNYTDIVKTFGGTAEDIYSPYKNPVKQITLDDIITPAAPAATTPVRAPAPIPASAPQPTPTTALVTPSIDAGLTAPATIFRPPTARNAPPVARPAAAAPAFTQKEVETYNAIKRDMLANGDVVVTYGNKQVNIGNVGDRTNMKGAQDLIFEWIRENKISVKGN